MKNLLILINRKFYSFCVYLNIEFLYNFIISCTYSISDFFGLSYSFPIAAYGHDTNQRKSVRGSALLKLNLFSYAISNIFQDPESNNMHELSYFANLSKSKRTFMDIGSYLGIYTMTFCATKRADNVNPKNFSVVAFDPSSTSKKQFAKNVKLNKFTSIKYCNYAMGGSVRNITMYDDTNFFTLFPTKGAKKKIVRQSTIDHEVFEAGIKPDLIKIDIEGLEYEALCGAKKTLNKYKPTIIVEIHPILLAKRNVKVESIFDILKQNKYTITDFYTGKKQTSASKEQLSKTAFLLLCE